MNDENKSEVYQFSVNFNDKVFFYTGKIIDRDEIFYTVSDIKIGNIKINKNKIITMRVI